MKAPWILLIVGIVFFVCSGGVAFVSLLLPALTNGRTDMEEAMLGVVPGSCCSALSLLMILGAVIWLVVGKKKT
jgi:hypothetical protein